MKHLSTLFALGLLCGSPALAQPAGTDRFLGSYSLGGRYSNGRGTSVSLEVERKQDGKLAVTRKGSYTSGAGAGSVFTWSSTEVNVAGTTLYARFRVPATGGAAGALGGGAASENVFVGTYSLSQNGASIREQVYNSTRRAPETGWTSIRSRGDRVSGAGMVPADLRPILERFRTRVRPEGDQGETTFTLEVVRLESEEHLIGMKILADETGRLADIDLALEKFSLLDLRVQHHDDPLAAIVPALFSRGPNWVPYFAGAFVGVDDTQTVDQARQRVRDLLQELGQGTRLSAFLVGVEGNYYGDYQDGRLWIRSREDPKTFLRVFCDVVHEI